MENEEIDDSWKKLTSAMTWRDILARYLEASQRVKDFTEANPKMEPIPVELAHAIGGLTTVYVGLRKIINDPSRYDELASPEMAECVLSLAGRILRDLPEQPIAKGAA